jgi:hypothetical protein
MAWTPPSDAVETQASSGTAGWTPPSDAIETAPAAPAEKLDTYAYTRLAKPTKFQSEPSKDGEAMVFNLKEGKIAPNIGNSYRDREGNLITRGAKVTDAEWIAERRANEAEPTSTFAGPGAVIVPRRTEFTPPIQGKPVAPATTAPVKAAPPMDMEAKLAAQEAKRAEFSPLEEAKKGVVGAATVGIPSSVEQFKLAGSAEVLQNTIQQMQLLDKIDKGEIESHKVRDTQADLQALLDAAQDYYDYLKTEADYARLASSTSSKSASTTPSSLAPSASAAAVPAAA